MCTYHALDACTNARFKLVNQFYFDVVESIIKEFIHLKSKHRKTYENAGKELVYWIIVMDSESILLFKKEAEILMRHKKTNLNMK